jgi:hypothetical protein
MAIFCGGISMILAGMWAFPRGDAFSATGRSHIKICFMTVFLDLRLIFPLAHQIFDMRMLQILSLTFASVKCLSLMGHFGCHTRQS